LFVVDGIPLDNASDLIPYPQDIESIDVLKDAAASAIYGQEVEWRSPRDDQKG